MKDAVKRNENDPLGVMMKPEITNVIRTFEVAEKGARV
jgi:hypothetical protein